METNLQKLLENFDALEVKPKGWTIEYNICYNLGFGSCPYYLPDLECFFLLESKYLFIRLYILNGERVCVSIEREERDIEEFYFFNEETREKVYSYIAAQIAKEKGNLISKNFEFSF